MILKKNNPNIITSHKWLLLLILFLVVWYFEFLEVEESRCQQLVHYLRR